RFSAAILASDEYFRQQGASAAAWLAGVYRDVLGRPPDAFGLDVWSRALGGGMSRPSVVATIAASPEAQSLIVSSAYRHFLGRQAGTREVQVWVAASVPSLTPQQLLAVILGSPEYRA